MNLTHWLLDEKVEMGQRLTTSSLPNMTWRSDGCAFYRRDQIWWKIWRRRPNLNFATSLLPALAAIEQWAVSIEKRRDSFQRLGQASNIPWLPLYSSSNRMMWRRIMWKTSRATFRRSLSGKKLLCICASLYWGKNLDRDSLSGNLWPNLLPTVGKLSFANRLKF